jgi:hypothetical protein
MAPLLTLLRIHAAEPQLATWQDSAAHTIIQSAADG